MKTISILGCGWLGLPLAKSLLLKGYEVKGSTTSKSKLEVFKNVGILPFQIQLEAHQIIGTVEEFLNETNVLLIAIPPGLRKVNSTLEEMTFVNKVKTLIRFIEKSGIQKVLFVSSTSVFGDRFPIVEITEETIPNPDTESGKQLAIAETLLQSNPHFKTTVIRFGGLIGEDRNPINQLQHKTIPNPDAPINLIHQMDCIGIIETILAEEKWNEVYQASGINTLTRRAYYTAKAKELGIRNPIFEEKIASKGKHILSKKIEKELNYTFKVIK
ncbi:NAD-dependent epimerase/dehydratase family protein [Flavobacterium sp. 20NA77.7]|uniref:NAD-dependent epimerase/dehydratase family protein n=1 Tax=Flavobacterium nakdongensis TaxID=3073563 RepID=A0ABY9R9X0_9FLAO|nr:NAD-dependent epimerase/dehydratase family protein [Flavobacterium sp. 20NA77.7]WMW78032.1 NAD-dependent epimerase/dehydratase family protein [Flavobacterium sp. 20NA77.7]